MLPTKQIPSPKLLIKDHKARKNWQFPLSLLIPATNFTACFSKVVYLGLKHVLDSHGIYYTIFSIVQASDLKTTLLQCRLNRSINLIFAIDVVNMYPSIKFSLIKKAVAFFSRKLPSKARRTLDT